MASRYVAVTFAETSKPRISVAKYFERRVIRAWKSLTHKPQRASVMLEDFVILNARRRSVLYAPTLH